MNSQQNTRPMPRAQAPRSASISEMLRPTPKLARIVERGRTLKEDRRYHIEAHRDVQKLADLIDDARHIRSAWAGGRGRSPPTLEAWRALFQAQIADAEASLKAICKYDDALDVSFMGSVAHEALADAIAGYLNQQISMTWTIDDLIEETRGLE